MARGKALNTDRLAALEKRIGHRFENHARLIVALTHSSAVKGGGRNEGRASDYERQEFLGDRVLALCVAQFLFETFPKADEGELSRRLNALVSGTTCARIADEIGLHEFIRASADLRQLSSKRMRSVRADVVESLIASIYLDAGLEAADRFVRRFWAERLEDDAGAERDSKTALQEWAHVKGFEAPVYEEIDRSGPDHDPVFEIEVRVAGTASERGRGRTKRAAEQDAAGRMLEREGADGEAAARDDDEGSRRRGAA